MWKPWLRLTSSLADTVRPSEVLRKEEMNLKKGLNRIFVLLALVASLFGFVLGGKYASIEWKPLPEEAFHSFNWSKENINKYYLTAKEEAGRQQSLGKRGPLDNYLFPEIKIEELPNYKKSPLQYNEYIFKKTFPEALKTPAYKIWICGGTSGVLLACFCYCGLHLILFVVKWIIDGFKDK